MTGYQLASRFRSHLSTCVRKVPLLAIAEYSLYGTTELARAAGFMGWLPKPVEPVALNALLGKLQTGASHQGDAGLRRSLRLTKRPRENTTPQFNARRSSNRLFHSR